MNAITTHVLNCVPPALIKPAATFRTCLFFLIVKDLAELLPEPCPQALSAESPSGHCPFGWIGGGKRDRTVDPLLAKQVLSQLSYAPVCRGGSGWIRTIDPRLIKTML